VARNHPQQQVTQENRHPESRNFGLTGRSVTLPTSANAVPVSDSV